MCPPLVVGKKTNIFNLNFPFYFKYLPINLNFLHRLTELFAYPYYLQEQDSTE